MTADPVQEARDEVIATAHDVHTNAQLMAALDAYAAAIRREEARPDPLASIPAEAREVLAAWLEAEYDQIADSSRTYAVLRDITDETKDEVWGTLAHEYLKPLAEALRGGGEG